MLARGSTYRVQYLVWTPESFFLFFPSYMNQSILHGAGERLQHRIDSVADLEAAEGFIDKREVSEGEGDFVEF